MEKLVATLENIPPLPAVMVELLQSLQSEDVNVQRLAEKIGQDPVLSARILRVVNSPFYGMAGQIGALSEAVMVMGFSSVKCLAMAASLCSRIPLKAVGQLNPKSLWEHSFACALAARLLAKFTQLNSEIAFTAGLLHDIGRIALYSIEPELFDTVQTLRTERGCTECEAENEVFGFNHASFGAQILKRWHLPETIIHAAEYHHWPDQEPPQAFTDLIYIANTLSKGAAQISMAHRLAQTEPTGSFIRLRLVSAHCIAALATLPEQLHAIGGMLQES